jgi:uncharacterized protein (TIGR03034 family)
MGVGYYVRVGDKTTCGGEVLSGDSKYSMGNAAVARAGDEVRCGKDGKIYTIAGGIATEISHGQLMAGTLHSRSTCPCRASFIPSLLNATYYFNSPAAATRMSQSSQLKEEPAQPAKEAEKNSLADEKNQAAANKEQPPKAIELPYRIFETQHQMDDYNAPDMKHGDLTEEQLREQYGIDEVKIHQTLFSDKYVDPDEVLDPHVRVNPYKSPVTAEILFQQFRIDATPTALYGKYSDLMRKMIQHMRENTGTTFSDPLLDQAMKERILEDKSEDSSLQRIKTVIAEKIDKQYNLYPEDKNYELTDIVSGSKLPRFDDTKDKFNGLGITVHDTWATHITLESLVIKDHKFTATITYHIQDHFGLDYADITHWLYSSLDLFKVWFVLQRWQGYNYQPFITDMNVTVTIEGTY